MTILDQIFEDIANIENERVDVKMSGESWTAVATGLAAHQAMKGGMKSPATSLFSIVQSRPILEEEANVSVITSIQTGVDYRRLLVEEQLKDSRFKPTADDVVDGGIKNGSKVVIKIVPENAGNFGSWDQLVQAKLLSDGTPKDFTFDKFSVMSLTEPSEQRYQIHQTMGADIIQTFGGRPVVLTISGQIVNGRLDVNIDGEIRSMDWKNAFQRYYSSHFSAHQCTKNRTKVRIFAQDTIYEGYMLNLVSAVTAMDQGLAQVTITFLLSSRNFPRENDDKIPGFIQGNGFALTGKTTPSNYFAQAELEHYFGQDATRIVSGRVLILGEEIDEKLERLALMDSSSNVTEDVDNYKTLLENLDDPETFEFVAPGFPVHEILLGSNTYNAVDSYSEQLKDLNFQISTYNEVFFGEVDSSSVIVPKKDMDDYESAVDVFQDLVIDQSRVYAQADGLATRLTKINNLCIEVSRQDQEKKHLEGL